jgi:hypothetical protein
MATNGTGTVNGLAEQRQRDEALTAARRDVLTKTNDLEAAQERLRQLEDQDFAVRLAKVPLSRMTLRERSETAQRLGHDEFTRLVLSQRR